MGKYQKYDDVIKELILKGYTTGTSISQEIIRNSKERLSADQLRKYCTKHLKAYQAPEFQEHCESIGVNPGNVNYYWHKSQKFSLNITPDRISLEEWRNEMIKEMKKYSPKYPVIKRTRVKDGHLLVISPTDIHVGKLCRAFETGDEYNSDIAVKRVMEGVDSIINKSSGFEIDEILLLIGNDVLHIDGPNNTTSAGTRQDVDGMWYESFMKAKGVYIKVMEKLLSIAPLKVMQIPSNHDYLSGILLADSLQSWFHKCKDITFDCGPRYRKYHIYGKNIIGATHGDGGKLSDLPLTMAHEVKEWGECKHRYLYTGHLHHKVAKDYMSVSIEVLRSPSGTDSWHAKHQYANNIKAIEGFIHSKEHGQVARLTNIF